MSLVGLAPAAVLGRWLDVSLMESLRLSEELSEEVRAGAQRMACRVLGLASRQATVLARLRAARAKALEAAALKARVAQEARRWEAEERAQAERSGFARPAEGERTLRNEADPAALKAAGLTRDGP